MAALTSTEQNARIFTEMRDGAILAEIEGHPLSEIIGAIRSLNDDERGRLIDDWLIAVISKYSHKLTEPTAYKDSYKLIMENCSKLAKSFGEESSSKRKTGGRNIYIRAVRTKASIAAGAAGVGQSSLGPKAVGGHVPTLMDRINAEVHKQLAAAKTTEAQREPFIEMDPEELPEDVQADMGIPISEPIQFVPTDAPGIPVAAARLLRYAYYDPLTDIPAWVGDYDLARLLANAPQLDEIEEPMIGEDVITSDEPAGKEFWASTTAKVASTMPHADSVNIPATGTGMTTHKGVAVDTSELKAIRDSRKKGPPPVAPVEPPPVLVSKKLLPKVFTKPLPKEKVVKETKPIAAPLTKEEKAAKRLEKRKIAIENYKLSRGK